LAGIGKTRLEADTGLALDQRDAMAGLGEIICRCDADDAATEDENMHGEAPLATRLRMSGQLHDDAETKAGPSSASRGVMVATSC
jgi:hypothetical protein